MTWHEGDKIVVEDSSGDVSDGVITDIRAGQLPNTTVVTVQTGSSAEMTHRYMANGAW